MGLLDPLYHVVAWILVQFHVLWSSLFFEETSGWAWVLSIVGLVIVIRIILIPLFVKQIKAQRGLQMLQPQIKEIQKRFKDDRQKQSEELMKLYKDTGTNPFSSCLPIILQMPIFFALFHVLSYGVQKQNPIGSMTSELVAQASQATVFGAPISATFLTSAEDLGGAELGTVRAVTLVLIAFMTLTTFITQKQLMVKGMPAGNGTNPILQQQKILIYVFPLMFAVFGINFPIGVLFYWLTTNLWSMGQQFYVIRRNPAPGSPAAAALEARMAAKAAKQAGTGSGATAIASTDDLPAPRPVRTQPKRKPRSQRKGAAGGAATPPADTGLPPKPEKDTP